MSKIWHDLGQLSSLNSNISRTGPYIKKGQKLR